MTTPLGNLLDAYRKSSITEREKGTYFEELILCYLRNEATYRDLYDQVWTYSQWAKLQGLDQRDTGIDLVARTTGTNEFHAIQCKLYDADYHLQKKEMRHGKQGKDKDLSTVIYNHRITITGIPPEAYDYVVNGKPAIEWVMERQRVKTDKASGIVSDANDWATETMGNPRYPLELLLRVVTVSLETMTIVKALPALGELTR